MVPDLRDSQDPRGAPLGEVVVFALRRPRAPVHRAVLHHYHRSRLELQTRILKARLWHRECDRSGVDGGVDVAGQRRGRSIRPSSDGSRARFPCRPRPLAAPLALSTGLAARSVVDFSSRITRQRAAKSANATRISKRDRLFVGREPLPCLASFYASGRRKPVGSMPRTVAVQIRRQEAGDAPGQP